MALLVTEINFLTVAAFIAGFISVVVNEETFSKFHNNLNYSKLSSSIYTYTILLIGLLAVFISDYYPFIYFRF